MGKKVETTLTRTVNSPGVIATSQVIVLKEQELDCDLATAIQRIRTCEETSQSRILVVAADDEAPEVDASNDLAVPATAPTTLGQVARRGGEAALVRIARELQPLEACLHRYLAEMQDAVAQVQGSLSVEQQGHAGIQALSQALDWTDALASDLSERVRDAAQGFQVVDTHELLIDMASQVEATYPAVRVTVGPVPGICRRAKPTALAEAFFLGIVLVAQRIGGRGSVTVEVEQTAASLAYRFLGHGEPRRVSAPECVRRFREIVVDLHGGRIHQDDLGSDGTGLVIHLPA